MIYLPVEPGSKEWHEARLGIPTASEFSKIVTPKGAPSRSSDGYACQLIAERLLGRPLDTYESDWMRRGKDLEDRAVTRYEFDREVDTTSGGFCLTDDRKAGCSPDRLVGDVGALEIKCPSEAVHVSNMLASLDSDRFRASHHCQVQSSLLFTGRSWWDLMSYHDELPPVIVRVYPDEEWQDAARKHLRAFLTGLDEMYERVLTLAGGTASAAV